MAISEAATPSEFKGDPHEGHFTYSVCADKTQNTLGTPLGDSPWHRTNPEVTYLSIGRFVIRNSPNLINKVDAQDNTLGGLHETCHQVTNCSSLLSPNLALKVYHCQWFNSIEVPEQWETLLHTLIQGLKLLPTVAPQSSRAFKSFTFSS